MNYSECNICRESYTIEGINEPKVLPCGHTFCYSCLQFFLNNLCPNCNKQFLPQSIVTNYTLREFIASNNLAEAEPPRKKYNFLELSDKDLKQELDLRLQDEALRNNLKSTYQTLSDVVSSINVMNQEMINNDRYIAKFEEDLTKLEERKITINSELRVLRQEELKVETEVARLVSLINQYPAEDSSSGNYPAENSSSGYHNNHNNYYTYC